VNFRNSLIALGLCAASLAGAQDPSRDYQTIATPHFRVSFTRQLEPVARRVAANAERAYGQLSVELHPPRGTIDILVTDDFDFSNGSATTVPSNRIIVYAMPPVNDFGLRYTTDWAQLVVTHELTHIFHLDRSRGIWRLGQYIFGRSPFLFPNSYQPSWLIEGLAVYEESRLAGQGRIQGPEHQLLVRAAALEHRFPRIGDASLAHPTFPQGTAAYGYGSLFLDYLAHTRGDSTIRKLVESSSAQLIPYLVDIPARTAFGTSFGAAWSEWRASIERTLFDTLRDPLPGWTPLARDQLVASYPRWLEPDRLVFTGTSGREMLSAYEVTANGSHSLGIRNGVSPTVRLPSGDLVFAQFEYLGPYRYRSDLYVQTPGHRPRRLTKGERLFAPDGRADGELVATQVTEGATRLVRVSLDGVVRPITSAHPDTLYSDPRWSHAGDRIAAARWIRGGIAQIVVLDSAGHLQRVLAAGHQLMAAWPTWDPTDEFVVFSTGFNLSRVNARTGVYTQISVAPSGLLEPEFKDPSTLAALTIRAGGYELGTGHFIDVPGSRVDSATSLNVPDPRLPTLAIDSSPAKKYSAIRQLRPRYWVPSAESGYDGAYLLGGYTEAWDILRRHYAYASVRVPTDNSGINWSLEHEYRGFGLPVISSSVSQDWTPFAILSRTSPITRVGTLRRRITDAEVLSSFVRQRVRSTLSFSIGAGIERRDYSTDPSALFASVDSGGIFRAANFPLLTASSAYARYYSPPFAISPEDGFTVAVTARERLKSGFNASGGPTTSVVGAVGLFKSLDLPGYAHHVAAVRASTGWADTRANGYFDVGGVSGGTYQIFPGYTIGEGRRTFPVRGFEPGSAQGIRAATASFEYRAPLSLTQRSISTLPAFLQRSSVTLFGDYGIAWCPSTLATRQVCIDPRQEAKTDLASVGGELVFSAGLLSWDSPTRFRIGIARPVHNGDVLGARAWTPYIASGISF
jgi:hypothetical protein